MNEHDSVTLNFIKPFSTVFFCGGLSNCLGVGGDGDYKTGCIVVGYTKTGVTILGPENAQGTPMAIAMGWD